MNLTSLLLLLKLMTVFVEPEDPREKDDRKLVDCAVTAMTERPSKLTIADSKDAADVVLLVGNHTGLRIHVLGRLTKHDGTELVEVNHVTHGFNHGLCNQMNGLLDELARKLPALAAISR